MQEELRLRVRAPPIEPEAQGLRDMIRPLNQRPDRQIPAMEPVQTRDMRPKMTPDEYQTASFRQRRTEMRLPLDVESTEGAAIVGEIERIVAGEVARDVRGESAGGRGVIPVSAQRPAAPRSAWRRSPRDASG